MKLLDLITPDELEAYLCDKTSKGEAYRDCEALRADWQPYADMLEQRVMVGDVTHEAFVYWIALITAISGILAKKAERRGVVN